MTDASTNGSEQSHPSWQWLLEDFERKLETLTVALHEARQAGQKLAQAHSAPGAASPLAAAPMADFAPPPMPVEAVAPPPVAAAPAAAPPVVEEDLARNEVRRAVEQARYDMENNGRMAAVGWSMPRDFWPGVTPETPADAPEPLPEDEDPARNEVRRMVEAAKADLAKGQIEPLDDADDDDGLDDIPPHVIPSAPIAAPDRSTMPSWTTMSITADSPSQPPASAPTPSPPAQDEEAAREEVRLAVERARNEMNSGQPPAARMETPVESDDDEEARREEVRRAVAKARNEMSWTQQDDDDNSYTDTVPAAPDDEDARRDDVRRAVERARAEMTGGLSGSDGLRMFDESAPPESDGLKTSTLFAAFSGGEDNTPAWQKAKDAEMAAMPASIVIEDEVGRVELARVYDTLNRVERPSASLLNYSPHSVTVGLAALEALPSESVMIDAIQAAFGRSCRVALDGSRMSVKIGDSEKAA